MKLETAKRWLILFYEKIQENEKVLAELDSFMGGDGDHGENMLRGMTAVVNEVEPREFESTADLFKNAGMLLLTKVGGVSGTLYGSAFFGIAHAVKSAVAEHAVCVGRMYRVGVPEVDRLHRRELAQRALYAPRTAASDGFFGFVNVFHHQL